MEQKTIPRVSFVMAVYNAAPYLQETLDSLYAQTFADFEIVVINDGSTDGSHDILKKQTDPRLRHLDNDRNRGVIFSANRGLKAARGEYIARIDADDLCRPDRLAVQVGYLDTHPECDLVAGFIEMFDNDRKPLGAWPEDRQADSYRKILKMLPEKNCLAQSTVMFRRTLTKRYAYRDIKLNPRYFAEDYDLWLQLAASGKRLEKIPKVLLDYRVHSGSASSTCNNPDLAPKLFSLEFWFACKDITTKSLFLWGRLKSGRFGLFEVRTLYFTLKEIFWRLAGQAKRALRRL